MPSQEQLIKDVGTIDLEHGVQMEVSLTRLNNGPVDLTFRYSESNGEPMDVPTRISHDKALELRQLLLSLTDSDFGV